MIVIDLIEGMGGGRWIFREVIKYLVFWESLKV